MTSRELFNATCEGEECTRPPFWLMRQAGRYLPEYRELKDKYGFLGIVKTPELAVEAALQPIRRFDFDCAIMFSDILTIPEALGIPYSFKDKGGIQLETTIKGFAEIKKLAPPYVIREKLSYITENLKMLRAELPDKAIFGFSGSPFTLAAYMVEGEGSQDFPKFKKFIKDCPDEFEILMEILSDAVGEYAKMQAECGIDAFQIFDSHGGIAPLDYYGDYSGMWTSKALKSIGGKVKTCVFAPAMSDRFEELATTRADMFSLDATVKFSEIRSIYDGEYTLQGNLDPTLLSTATPQEVAQKTEEIITDVAEYGQHIFNLGHGIRPDAKIENVEALCETVKNTKK